MKPTTKPDAPTPPPPLANGLVEMVVWSVPAVNRSLVICHEPGADGADPLALVNVRVRDNTNFLKKMRLVARHVADRRYALEGPCPRWRGRW